VKYLGLLMVSDENDILAATLEHNLQYVDAFYALDGTVPNTESERICRSFDKCAGYITDAELPRPPFPDRPVCGYRKAIHDMAVADYGPDNWFLILHGDEVWTFDPRDYANDPHDGFVFNLPFYFPRAGERWDDNLSPLAQLRWHFRPGYPEIRLFRGHDGVGYDPGQQWNAGPQGLKNIGRFPRHIKHYLYRAPAVQRERAERHVRTGFDPDNYRHILDHDAVYWDDARIASTQLKPHFAELACDWS
jgi:hypothetical protein